MLVVHTFFVHSKQFRVTALGAAVFVDEPADIPTAFFAQLPIEEMGLSLKMGVVSGREREGSDYYRSEDDKFVHELVLNLNNN